MGRRNRCDNDREKKDHKKKKCSVYGEFIRTFTFDDSVVTLPIVQPGGSLIFPTPTVPPKGVVYVDEPGRVGLLVPKGTYLVSWRLNPGEGATVDLLVNGVLPLAGSYPYTRAVTTTVLDVEYLVEAPLKENNLISLVNGGSSLFTLNNLPNTTIGITSLLTQIRVQSI